MSSIIIVNLVYGWLRCGLLSKDEADIVRLLGVLMGLFRVGI